MVKKGPKKRADNRSKNNNSLTEQSIEGDASNEHRISSNDAVSANDSETGSGKPADNGAGSMLVTEIGKTDLIGAGSLESDRADLNEEIDWSLNSILNHPSGVDFALKKNLAIMEKQTKELIENGSTEDLLRALEENTRQLEMLKERMEGNISWLTTLA